MILYLPTFCSDELSSTVGSAGKRIGVACMDGEVLLLRADWLV
jgi:hypothetical protein